jgi:acyl-coenzyme A synthetase/AMP-(fatty) acid ligase
LYGPTETNVCTFYEVGPVPADQRQPVPIGRACSGDRVWAALQDGTPAAVGQEGELMVEGPTVMAGYWGGPPQPAGPYATGDRVVLQEDGNYRYLGRGDGMVKIRGNRVELGEVEAALQTHPAVDEAAVVVAGAGIEARMTAFVVPVAGESLNLLEAKRHCAEVLPRHMIVDAVRNVGALPRTGNGKVDRRALVDGLVVLGDPER